MESVKVWMKFVLPLLLKYRNFSRGLFLIDAPCRCCSLLYNIERAADLLAFDTLREHDNDGSFLLPDHSPEVDDGVL